MYIAETNLVPIMIRGTPKAVNPIPQRHNYVNTFLTTYIYIETEYGHSQQLI